MDNIQILDMTLDDFREIEEIYSSHFDDFWQANNLKSELENINSKYIVAKLENKTIGFAGIWFSVDDAHITNIVVHKAYRQQGVGSLLLKNIINIAKCKDSLTLEVNTKNENAQKLYLKFGFKNLGVRKKYYNNTEDAFIMTLYF